MTLIDKIILEHGETIKKMYYEELLNRAEICRILNVKQGTMVNVFKKLGIKMRSRSETVMLYKKCSFDEVIGTKINRLTIHSRDINKNSNLIVSCECSPENKYSTNGFGILDGKLKSCGCLKNELTAQRNREISTHGMSKTKIYYIHYSMLNRCNNNDNKDYKHYGDKGIKVCDEWNSSHDGFLDFYRWSLNNGYQEGLSIDRIDNDGNYEPSNCRWISMSENIGKRNTEYALKNKKLKGGK